MKRIWILLLIFLLPFSAAAEKHVTLTFVGDCTIGGEDRLREEDFPSMLIWKSTGMIISFVKCKA